MTSSYYRNPRRQQPGSEVDRPKYIPQHVQLGREPMVTDPNTRRDIKEVIDEDFRRAKEVGRPAAQPQRQRSIGIPVQNASVHVGSTNWYEPSISEKASETIYADEIPDPPHYEKVMAATKQPKPHSANAEPQTSTKASDTYVLMVQKQFVHSSDSLDEIKETIAMILSPGDVSVSEIVLFKRLAISFGVTIEEW